MDYGAPWYHGSPLELTVLRAGSTVTQWRDLARVFSHKPALVLISDDRRIRHTGTRPGYLYEIAEPVGTGDVRPHLGSTMEPGDEWLTNRDLRLHLIATTAPEAEELLSADEAAALRRRAASQAS